MILAAQTLATAQVGGTPLVLPPSIVYAARLQLGQHDIRDLAAVPQPRLARDQGRR
jgi:hypothetical protein